ncbi:MAG: cation:dicarboxylase symporter family transporter [Chitinophagaceae bacterium]|nr:cation:dicarboxylase symporter family transporter [Chitinophagaceae bacterium]
MKSTFIKKIGTNLTFWVLVSILLGILTGHYFPEVALTNILQNPISFHLYIVDFEIKTSLSEFLSSIFISTVKLFINPIIFLTIILGIVNMGDIKQVGTIGWKSLVYFEIVTTFALLIGIVVAYIIEPGNNVPQSMHENALIHTYKEKAKDFHIIPFLRANITLQVLLLSIVLGILLHFYSQKEKIILLLHKISHRVFQLLAKVMIFAPIGAFGGMAFTVGKYGIGTLAILGKLMLTVYVTMVFFVFGVLGLILWYYKIKIGSFLIYIKEEILIVLGTSSSEAALPYLMQKLEAIGCHRSIVSLVVPAGYSFNLDGTTIYLSMSVLFLAQVFHIHLDFTQFLTIIGVLMITSKGAAGVTGSGFIVLTSTLTTLQIIPLEGLSLLIGVDRFMSEARAITNFIGNGVATVFIAHSEKQVDTNKMPPSFYAKEKNT